jgi:hypothetical protein
MPNSQSFCFFFQKAALPCLARVRLKAGWYYNDNALMAERFKQESAAFEKRSKNFYAAVAD